MYFHILGLDLGSLAMALHVLGLGFDLDTSVNIPSH